MRSRRRFSHVIENALDASADWQLVGRGLIVAKLDILAPLSYEHENAVCDLVGPAPANPLATANRLPHGLHTP